MGLIGRLAARRTAVLVAEVPGWARTRCAVEQQVRSRGWRLADSPADADLLVVCGDPGPRFAAALDLVWAQLPGPRARAQVLDPAGVAAALDDAAAQLADEAAQRHDAGARPDEPPQGVPATDTSIGADAADAPDDDAPDDDAPDDDAPDDDADGAAPPAWDDPHPGSTDQDETDQDDGEAPGADEATGDSDHDGDTDDDSMGDGDMSHGDMGDGDMGGMDMPMPGGIPLAGGAGDEELPDPDGLDLDVLHLPLGPVLPHWPAGLLLHTTVQGERIVAARAEVLEPAADAPAGGSLHGTPAGRWDAVATLLALAGWADTAAAAARLRDAALTDAVPERESERLARRVRRSRLLRWSLRGVGVLPEGDAADRLAHWLAGTAHGQPITLQQVADLVTGLDLATARLVVASLDLDTTAREPVPVEGA
ncbi:hypothetical protein [uncultured Modestobacter sp.]|uniref:hypothetical protein n=1 Tax=uncultured Modestobacter sp. TaxID=380048 RepID=UPI0026397F40|nr:hypothetical protein [uncultured Modestobacter sp.]